MRKSKIVMEGKTLEDGSHFYLIFENISHGKQKLLTNEDSLCTVTHMIAFVWTGICCLGNMESNVLTNFVIFIDANIIQFNQLDLIISYGPKSNINWMRVLDGFLRLLSVLEGQLIEFRLHTVSYLLPSRMLVNWMRLINRSLWEFDLVSHWCLLNGS